MQESNKASIHGVPGDRARASGVMRALWPLLIAVLLCGIFIGATLPQIGLVVAGSGFLLAAIALAWTALSGLKGIDAYFKGARGEESVALLLADLPHGYHVFHDVYGGVPGGIDHVVVGESGVFVIETKCWSGVVTVEGGAIRVDGTVPHRAPLDQAQVSSRSLGDFLSERLGETIECQPVVCFASNTFVGGPLKVDGALVCNADVLRAEVVTGQRRLTDEVIERIVKVVS